VKIFYSDNSLFIGARGQFHKLASIRLLRDFWRAHVHSDVPRVTFFTKLQSFHGIESSESTRFPEGLVLGNSGKIRHPQNVNLRSLEVANLRRSGISNPRSPEVANLRRSGISNLRSLEVTNL
jgi:hypothetical protein